MASVDDAKQRAQRKRWLNSMSMSNKQWSAGPALIGLRPYLFFRQLLIAFVTNLYQKPTHLVRGGRRLDISS